MVKKDGYEQIVLLFECVYCAYLKNYRVICKYFDN